MRSDEKGVYTSYTPSGRTVLYDLGADPAELRDLAGERPEIAADLLRELLAWDAGTTAAGPALDGRVVSDEDALRMLEELGYVK